MSEPRELAFVALIDGTTGDATRQARALAAFIDRLPDTAATATSGETAVFCTEPATGRKLAGLAPTRDVRLVAAPARRPDVMIEQLVALGGGGADLYLAGPGSVGAELAVRLACRTGGAVLSEVLDLRLAGDTARCRTTLYSGHLTGRFDLGRRPWCLSLDASWADERRAPVAEHCVFTATDQNTAGGVDGGARRTAPGTAADTGAGSVEPFADVELVAPLASGDLADARFLVVAGYGAGCEGVGRFAAAARRMGADFGVSRPVAMNAWAPLDRLVGASGARSAPLVCLVVAASGAPALYWGIERAALIAAVNTDEHAPIVRNADAVVVDDAVAVVEALAEIVEPRRRD